MALIFRFMFMLLFLLSSSMASSVPCKHTYDLQILQWRSGWTGQHVPEYTVQMINGGSHSLSEIIVNCGTFASTLFINPNVFKRIGNTNTCMVNGGDLMAPGKVIRFRYANILPFKFTVSSFKC
ncbi:hypothetical protein QJS04_geneDACA017211 [Acorus gramineus]|uniref:Uncharacterized protein n=1 Tax=Acorus gramineus TaxID=55184 RepID=A0AAV9BLX0_ACOGR|nr:hypothetical protein QJS04_geneDACA017211 [Acorus gramineus]